MKAARLRNQGGLDKCVLWCNIIGCGIFIAMVTIVIVGKSQMSVDTDRVDSLFQAASTASTTSAEQPSSVSSTVTATTATAARGVTAPRWQNGGGSCPWKTDWLQRAGNFTGLLPKPGDLPWHCEHLQKVCFHNNEVVIMQDQGVDGYVHPAGLDQLRRVKPVLEGKGVGHVIPGYLDNFETSTMTFPIGCRLSANDRSAETQDLEGAPMLDTVPIVVVATWPFNFGESMWNGFIFPWLHAAYRNTTWRHLPIAVVIPHSLRLPAFWQILQPFISAAESFERIGQESTEGPLCFKRAMVCKANANVKGLSPKHPVMKMIHAPRAKPDDWHKIVDILVEHWCPVEVQKQRRITALPADGPLVVGVLKRGRNRNMANIEEFLKECNANNVSGRRFVCKPVEFSDPTKDVCAAQYLDILIGNHGAGLTNAAFLRDRTVTIELKGFRWWQRTAEHPQIEFWANMIWRQNWYTNTSLYWEYRADEKHSISTMMGQTARDVDIRVEWFRMACYLREALDVNGDRREYSRRADLLAAPRLIKCDGFD